MALRVRAVKSTLTSKPWAEDKDFLMLGNAAYRSKEGLTIQLAAKIADVQEVLAKGLKPQRKLLTAVRFTDGKIEETRQVQDADAKVVELPVREPEKPQPVAAVTVAKPVVGCPMPVFQEADVRASRVLEAFLDEDQIKDYRKLGAFVTVGVDSGHRYLVANRERPNMLKKCGGRQLYDLEEDRALCIHDWSVPPPEEMLALHLLLSIPGQEQYIRTLPEILEH